MPFILKLISSESLSLHSGSLIPSFKKNFSVRSPSTFSSLNATKFDYSDAFTSDNLKTLRLPLPVQNNQDGTPYIDIEKKYSDNGFIPDWKYMTEYMKSIEEKAQVRIDILKQISLL